MNELKGEEIAKAKAIEIGIAESKSGVPQVAVGFLLENGKQMTWYGSLKEGRAREITMDVLKTLNFSGKLADLVKKTGIDFKKEVSLTIDDEFNQDQTKSFRRIKWINDTNRGAKLLDETNAMLKLQGLGIEADLAAIFSQQPAINHHDTAEEVPF